MYKPKQNQTSTYQNKTIQAQTKPKSTTMYKQENKPSKCKPKQNQSTTNQTITNHVQTKIKPTKFKTKQNHSDTNQNKTNYIKLTNYKPKQIKTKTKSLKYKN
jgi:hypothetical protein